MPAAKQPGVPRIGFHTLRHTCASILFELKAPRTTRQRSWGASR